MPEKVVSFAKLTGEENFVFVPLYIPVLILLIGAFIVVPDKSIPIPYPVVFYA